MEKIEGKCKLFSGELKANSIIFTIQNSTITGLWFMQDAEIVKEICIDEEELKAASEEGKQISPVYFA